MQIVTFCLLLVLAGEASGKRSVLQTPVGDAGASKPPAKKGGSVTTAFATQNPPGPPRSSGPRKVLAAVVVIPTFEPRHSIVDLSGGTWRKGLHAFVATNGSESSRIDIPNTVYPWGEETWWQYPDEPVKAGGNPGAKRYLASVRLANASFWGRFDWLIVGDDDVIFLLDNLRDLLRKIDPSKPAFVTDDLASCCHNNCTQDVPACVIPGQDSGTGPSNCVRHPATLPCERATLEKGACPAKDSKPWFGGGRGAIISRGLMTAISAEKWQGCEDRLTGGGAERVAKCIWENGFGPTNPTVALAPAGAPFSKCAFGRFSPYVWMSTLDSIVFHHGICNDDCLDVINGVSIHLALDNGAADPLSIERARHEMIDISAGYRKARHQMFSRAHPRKKTPPSRRLAGDSQ